MMTPKPRTHVLSLSDEESSGLHGARQKSSGSATASDSEIESVTEAETEETSISHVHRHPSQC